MNTFAIYLGIIQISLQGDIKVELLIFTKATANLMLIALMDHLLENIKFSRTIVHTFLWS